jgi:hypothetical protein
MMIVAKGDSHNVVVIVKGNTVLASTTRRSLDPAPMVDHTRIRHHKFICTFAPTTGSGVISHTGGTTKVPTILRRCSAGRSICHEVMFADCTSERVVDIATDDRPDECWRTVTRRNADGHTEWFAEAISPSAKWLECLCLNSCMAWLSTRYHDDMLLLVTGSV